MRIRVLVVDDQLRARHSLKALLAIDPRIEEISQADSGSQALALIEQSAPDLAVIDARMPEIGGIQVTREIKRRWPRIKIIVLSMYVEYKNDALAAGADAFVSKGEHRNTCWLPWTLMALADAGPKYAYSTSLSRL